MLLNQVAKRRFSVEEYHKMDEVGIFREGARVELVEGEIVEMTPIGSRHHACVMKLDELLRRGFSRYIVSVQGPLRLNGQNELQPDLALLRRRDNFYADILPGQADALLVIEVSDTSFSYDRDIKLPLYAKNDVPEAWIVDLLAETVEVYSRPEAGRYTTIRKFTRGDELYSINVEGVELAVDELLLQK